MRVCLGGPVLSQSRERRATSRDVTDKMCEVCMHTSDTARAALEEILDPPLHRSPRVTSTWPPMREHDLQTKLCCCRPLQPCSKGVHPCVHTLHTSQGPLKTRNLDFPLQIARGDKSIWPMRGARPAGQVALPPVLRKRSHKCASCARTPRTPSPKERALCAR